MLYQMTDDQNKTVLLSIIIPRVVLSLEKDQALITHSQLKFSNNYIQIIDGLIDVLNHEDKLCRKALRQDNIKVSDVLVYADGVNYVARYKGIRYNRHISSDVVRVIVSECITGKVKVEMFSIYT